MKVLVTGSKGFIGRNLVNVLRHHEDVEIFEYDRKNTKEQLHEWITMADIVFHLAGVNRAEKDEEFDQNVEMAQEIYDHIKAMDGHGPRLVFASSTQALKDNPYGKSKIRAERIFRKLGNQADIIRLPNVFGKWCRPNYNSVVATFCYKISRGMPIEVDDYYKKIKLVYIDDVVDHLINIMHGHYGPLFVHREVTVGQVALFIRSFYDWRGIMMLPDSSDKLFRDLYSTYMSYVPDESLRIPAVEKKNETGSFYELIKFHNDGQVSVLKVLPGKERGGHYHNHKVEKFIVVAGEGNIILQKPQKKELLMIEVSGKNPDIIDIPPGYIHSIENTGDDEMIVILWTSEVYNPKRTDTWRR